MNWPLLPAALAQFAAANSNSKIVFIAGGGAFADVVRSADTAFGLGEDHSHDLCVEVLGVTSRLLAGILQQTLVISDWSELVSRKFESCIVFNPVTFLQALEPRFAAPLPRTWSVTTDSIAARIAELLPADELVLLKSADPPCESLVELADRGYVDAYFSNAVKSVQSLRFVNLRTTLV